MLSYSVFLFLLGSIFGIGRMDEILRFISWADVLCGLLNKDDRPSMKDEFVVLRIFFQEESAFVHCLFYSLLSSTLGFAIQSVYNPSKPFTDSRIPLFDSKYFKSSGTSIKKDFEQAIIFLKIYGPK